MPTALIMIIDILPYLSIALESLIIILGILIATQNKKSYGWGLTLTFALYVFYDFARIRALPISNVVLYSILTVASLSTLWAVYKIYRGK